MKTCHGSLFKNSVIDKKCFYVTGISFEVHGLSCIIKQRFIAESVTSSMAETKKLNVSVMSHVQKVLK